MIEVIKNKSDKELYLIEGNKIFECDVEEIGNSYYDSNYFIIVWNGKDFDYILENSKNLNSRVIGLECPVYKKWNGICVSVRIDLDDGFYGVFKITFERWKWNFSPQQYFTELVRITGSELVDVEIDEEDSFITSIRVFPKGDEDISLASPVFQKTFSIITKFHKEAIQRLNFNNSTDSILSLFDFPEELKIPCEQYLLYFATFLRDLGINASSNLEEKAGKVLFSVTPTDDIEALDKIREALAIYLNLPASPIIYDDSFAAMRLQQQIENLHHSQKMAARELQFNEKLLVAQSDIIREKDLLISQKDSTIEQQQKIIDKISSKSIMMDSLENKDELEEIYDGLKIGESKFLKEQLGIHLNPAKVIKTAVKNTLGKDDKKSILGLDEES